MPIMKSFHDDFDSADGIEEQSKYLGNASEADFVYTGHIASHNDAVLLQMPNQSTGSVISSTKYLWYGKIGLNMKTSRDRGVVTAFITFSDVQDEIDYEFMGYQLNNPQSNYYALGITNYTNVKNSTTSNTFENWHYYEIDWHEDHIDWSIDGEKVRTLERSATWNDTSKRYLFPQTPSRLQLSLWPAGSDLNQLGTIEWAGGAINWDSEDIKENGYYYAYVKNITVEAYDWPDSVKKNYSNISAYNAFKFDTSNKPGEKNVYLTKEKTWLGSDDATGFDPQNDSDSDDDDDTLTTVKSSGSHTTTETKSTGKTTKGGKGNGGQKTTSTDDYTGGFVQGGQTSKPSKGNKDGSGLSGSGLSSGAGYTLSLQSLVTIVSTIVGFFFAFAY